MKQNEDRFRRRQTSDLAGQDYRSDQIADGGLDFAYIDADHTLKGIAIDLIRVYPKVRSGGFLGGDDFTRSVWEHNTRFEPTLVFPFAVYFAEAVGATIYALPYSQFRSSVSRKRVSRSSLLSISPAITTTSAFKSNSLQRNS
jgi:hypothetical protein